MAIQGNELVATFSCIYKALTYVIQWFLRPRITGRGAG